MRLVGIQTRLQLSKPDGRSVMRTALASAVALALLGATNGSTALQDIAEMTGTNTSKDARWLTRLVSVPRGSVHGPEGVKVSINHAMAVQTFEGRHMLDPSYETQGSYPAKMERSLKGDSVRVVLAAVAAPVTVAKVQPMAMAALTAPVLHVPNPEIKDGAATSSEPTRFALAFRTSKGMEENLYEDGIGEKRINLSDGQMSHARAAAGKMTRVLAKVRKAAESGDATLAAYAPQEKDIASAFAAVLSPNRGGVIRLGRGDHKWAARPLPKSSRSRTQRRCLSNGVYFEARGESVQGQKAVAQVILNRVKNPAYPNSICGVVYQNKQMRNACQFSFACDGIRDRVSAGRHWTTAQKVAKDAIEGRFWLASVGSSSHYHADYVWPRWRRSMKRMVKIGRHIFYRTYGGGWS